VFLLPLIAMPGVALWFLAVVPEPARATVTETAAMGMFFLLAAVFSLLVAGTAAATLWRRRPVFHLPGTVLLAVLAFCATGATEFVREGIRKPWVVTGVLYSNGVAADEVRTLRKKGVLSLDPWPLRDPERYPDDRVRAGRLVYRELCSSCHTPRGVNGLLGHTRTWDREMLEANIAKLHRLKPFMPPFAGTEHDIERLCDWLEWLRGEE
jgi:mono/diheme cytochrome c family protein